MASQYSPYDNDQIFVGRNAELRWLEHALSEGRRRSFAAVIYGPGGIGKTSLIKHFIATRESYETPVWLDFSSLGDSDANIESFISRTRVDSELRPRDILAVLDGVEGLTDRYIEEAVGKILNRKVVRSIIISSRRPLTLERSESIALGSLGTEASTELLHSLLSPAIPPNELANLLQAADGLPRALRLLAEIVRTQGAADLPRLLTGSIYDLSDIGVSPASEIVAAAKPIIISASEALVSALQKQPEDLLRISSRDFERLLAELLSDMGWEVELTKATRDGGKDILAYMNTDIGKLLCLVEAKRYRVDRKIGVDLVRGLYGTLCDFQANSAMMVTTSSFSPDAREFQQKHQYQMSLKEYADVIGWINRYKVRSKTQ